MLKERGALIWGYVVELVLSILLLSFLTYVCKCDVYARMIEGHKNVWFVVVGLLLTVSVAVLAAFLTAVGNEFGEWLHHIRAFNAYFAAFASPVPVYMVTIGVIACSSSGSRLLSMAGSALLFYTLITTVTSLKNLCRFYGLWFEFRRTRSQGPQQGTGQ